MHALHRFATRYLIADAAPLSAAERWRSSLAGLFGMLLIQGVLTVAPLPAAYRHLLAPLGASSVILFALPHSPLGQPWSTAGGLLLSGLIGLLCGQWIHPNWLAIASALGLSIWLMARLRCIHPPGGAMAIVFASTPALGGEIGSILLNIGAVLFAALAINSLLPGRRWPQCAPATAAPAPQPERESEGIAHADLQYALQEIDAYLDISEEDLVQVYDLATRHALQRHDQLTCGEIMQAATSHLEFATELESAWQRLRQQPTHCLPVTDRSQRVIGLLGADDFLRHITPQGPGRLTEQVRQLLRPSRRSHSERPEVVGQIMSSHFPLARTDEAVSQLAGRLLNGRLPACIPVTAPDGKLAGVISQKVLLANIYHHQAARQAQHAMPAPSRESLDAPHP
ncbi:MAG: CBS domain-containing protein [Rhodocyclales bacterium GT-UBC]|nr:MAG: CBS domain-containing protein [Rhodocyclales bacterium GT-UBC]